MAGFRRTGQENSAFQAYIFIKTVGNYRLRTLLKTRICAAESVMLGVDWT